MRRIAFLPSVAGAVLAISVLAAASAAQTVTGVIRDEVTGMPVAGAIVTLLTKDSVRAVRTLSTGDGAFRLRARAAGEYLLGVSALGFGELMSRPLALTADATNRLEVWLSPKALEVQPMTVRPERSLGARRVDAYVERRTWRRVTSTAIRRTPPARRRSPPPPCAASRW